ncbi:hypothetical protein GHV81_04185 [Pseudomonas aeruginosa]|nr:hypothetical protein [Pseudomonas aeruginosa]HEJ4955358.1 hypothetical protein [Pseudomonas aeruginosa]
MNGVKTLTAIVVMTAAFSVNADYMVKIPLEMLSGGALPNNSLVFVSTNTPDITPPEKNITFTIPANVNETYPNSDNICQASSYSNGVEVTQFYYGGSCMNGHNLFTVSMPRRANDLEVSQMRIMGITCTPTQILKNSTQISYGCYDILLPKYLVGQPITIEFLD